MTVTRSVRWVVAFLGMSSSLIIIPKHGIADEYPSRTITLVVPFAAGGGTDALGRVIAQKLGERVGKSVVVENKPGAGSMLGASAVAKAAPDGYTLLDVTNSAIAVTPVLYKNSPYDPMRDFTPLAMVSGSPFFLAVNPRLPIKTASDLIALAKAKPKELTYSSAGVGSTAHIFMELFMKQAGIQLIHVPYGGSAPALNDVIAGNVDMTFTDPTLGVQMANSGQVRLIGISTKTRSPSAPNVPPISETGLPGYDALAWVAIVGPSGMPPEIVKKLNSELEEVIQSDDFKKFLETNGSVVLDISTVEATREFFATEISKWGDLLRSIGLTGVQ